MLPDWKDFIQADNKREAIMEKRFKSNIPVDNWVNVFAKRKKSYSQQQQSVKI